MSMSLKFKNGNPSFTNYMTKAKTGAARAMEKSVAEAMVAIQNRAMLVLDNQIYSKPRRPFDRALTEELLHSWQHEVRRISYGSLGILTNTSDHAGYIEFGTVAHDIVARKASSLGRRKKRTGAAYLHWIDPDTGEDMFAERVHVSGVEATHFLEIAADMVGPGGLAIVAIFERNLQAELP